MSQLYISLPVMAHWSHARVFRVDTIFHEPRERQEHFFKASANFCPENGVIGIKFKKIIPELLKIPVYLWILKLLE